MRKPAEGSCGVFLNRFIACFIGWKTTHPLPVFFWYFKGLECCKHGVNPKEKIHWWQEVTLLPLRWFPKNPSLVGEVCPKLSHRIHGNGICTFDTTIKIDQMQVSTVIHGIVWVWLVGHVIQLDITVHIKVFIEASQKGQFFSTHPVAYHRENFWWFQMIEIISYTHRILGWTWYMYFPTIFTIKHQR